MSHETSNPQAAKRPWIKPTLTGLSKNDPRCRALDEERAKRLATADG